MSLQFTYNFPKRRVYIEGRIKYISSKNVGNKRFQNYTDQLHVSIILILVRYIENSICSLKTIYVLI